MEIKENKHGAVTVVKPVGPITRDDAEKLKERLTAISEKNLGRLVLDASSISFMDSRGLEVLAEVTDELAMSGQALKLCGLNEVLREVLDLTELASSVERFEDVNAAVRSFM